MNLLRTIVLPVLTLTACAAPGPPAFPNATTAQLAGPLCDTPGQPCQCALDPGDVGTPPGGSRRFEVQLPHTRATASSVVISGIGALVRDEDNPEGSCFYLDLRPGATYDVRYMAQAHSRERGISVAFTMRELSPEGSWYDVVQQHCGSDDEPCHYQSVSDWTQAVSGGHRFHDPCGSSLIEGVRVEGGLYDRRFTDAQFSFGLRLVEEAPTQPPGSACRRDSQGNLILPDTPPDQEEGEEEVVETTDDESSLE